MQQPQRTEPTVSDPHRPTDLRGCDRWRARLNSPVTNVQTFWERWTVWKRQERQTFWERLHIGRVRITGPHTVDVPVALRIDFAAGPVWIVAGMPEGPEMREIFVGCDEIVVVFTGEKMRQIGFPDSGFLSVGRG